MLKKIFTPRNGLLAVVVLIIAALITTTAVVSSIKPTPTAGTVDAAVLSQTAYASYTVEDEGAFRRSITAFLQNILDAALETFPEEQTVTLSNSSLISNRLLSVFSRAGIPSEKMLKFGEYLANLDGEENFYQIVLFMFVVNEDETVVRFAPAEKMADLFNGKVDWSIAINDIVAHTAITAEECGKLGYELLYSGASDSQRVLLERLGRANFVTLFITTSTVYEGFMSFSVEGGSLTEARLIGELAFQLGSDLSDLLGDMGRTEVLASLGLGGDTTLNNSALLDYFLEQGVGTETLADIAEVNSVVSAVNDLAGFALEFGAEALTAVDNSVFESLAYYYEYAEDATAREEYLALHYVRLAKAISVGLKAAYAKGTEISTQAELLKRLAVLKVNMENLDAPVADIAARRAEVEAILGEYINNVNAVAARFGEIVTQEDVKSLSTADYAALSEYSAYFSDFDTADYAVGSDKLMTTLFTNAIFNGLSAIIAEAVGANSAD